MGAARLLELAFSQRNLRASTNPRESVLSRVNFVLIAALNIAVIGGTLLFGRNQPKRSWLLALLAVQPLRYWLIATLGRRWNVRGAVSPDLVIATDGPYACLRHPNYTVLAVELAALPAAFGLARLAAVATLVNLVVLAVRVREEEALLFEVPGYREHFAHKRRFVPGVF
jgi:methyltransferase